MSTDALSQNDDLASSNNESTNVMLLLILAVVVLLAYLPSLFMHFQGMWQSEQYQYFPFIIAAVGYMAWKRWQEASLVEHSDSLPWYRRLLHDQLSIVCVLMAITTLAVAVYCQWGWFAAVSFNLLAGAGLLVLSKYFHIRNAWGIWALMWLMVPPPIEFGTILVQRMQLISSRMGSQILDLLGIDHLMAGNVFTLPTKQLFVDEACSGIVSVMSVIAATSIYAVWKDRSLFHAVLLVLISVGWAVVMNTIRIVSIAIAEAKFGTNLAEGTSHELLGLVLFSLTFIASISTDQFLEFLLIPIHVAGGDTTTRRNPLVRIWNWFAGCFVPQVVAPNAEQSRLNRLLTGIMTPKLLVTGIPIALVGVWSGLVFFGVIGGKPVQRVDALTLTNSVHKSLLASELGAWTQTDYSSSRRSEEDQIQEHYDFGQFSNSFVYGNSRHEAHVSMDFPFTGGWHELSACYRASGWDIVSRQAQSEDGREYVETTLEVPDHGQYGYLLFNNFNERGVVISPPTGAVLFRSWLFIRRRLLRQVAGDVYQVQTFVTSDKPFTEAEKQSVKTLFLTAEKKLTEYVGAASRAGEALRGTRGEGTAMLKGKVDEPKVSN